jgi:dTDP-glucose 4,6-dehydratase
LKVLVTGACGFIGSHLVEAHLNFGDEVLALDNLSTGKISNLPRIKEVQFINGDLSRLVDRLPKDIDLIYHFASPASPEKYLAMPLETMEVNTNGTLALLDYSRRNSSRLVFASTSEVYGDPLLSPQKEDYWGNVNPVGPRSVYDEAKRFGETLVSHYQRGKEVNAGIVRIFNTYGPNMDPFDGRVVSTFIRQALTKEAFTIFGDGTQTRSFCYVDDLINGIILMGKSSEPGPINLGNPREVPLTELTKIIDQIVGRRSEILFKDLPVDDPKQRKPDISLAKQRLGWEPIVALEDGINRTVEWMRLKL